MSCRMNLTVVSAVAVLVVAAGASASPIELTGNNGDIETDLSGWSVATVPSATVTYDTAQFSPFTSVYATASTGSAKLHDFSSTAGQAILTNTLSATAAAGTATVSYDFRPSGTSSRKWAFELYDSSSTRLYQNQFDAGTGATTDFLYNGVNALSAQIISGTWYNVSMVIDFNTDALSGTLSDSSGVLETWTGAYAGDLKTIRFIDPSGSQKPDLWVDNVSVLAVPEPATMALLSLGGLGVLVRRRRR